ncbi:MAG: CPBP family intramembrane metalloprotease [Chloroflexota bacterium]|nr:CPBP family intramembrane metalloprotease [Chloroflexota bacterium]
MTEFAPVPPPPVVVAERPARRRQRRGMDGLLVAAWLLSVVGTAVLVVGLALAALEATGPASGIRLGVRAGVPAALTGGVMVLVGLSAASYRSIVLRRELGDDRYRGPSILVLLAIVLVVGNLVTLPFIGSFVDMLNGSGAPSALETLIVLASTSVVLLAVAVIFVGVPRALPGVRLLPRAWGRLWQSFGLGILIGGPVWIVATVLSYFVSIGLSAVLDQPPDVQLVEEVFPHLNPWAAALVIVVAAPVSEEVFFRGIVLNAWWREYGFVRALLGSSFVFAAFHFSLFAFVPIFLLALVLGYVYAQTRSLITVIGIHATFNAISTAILLIQSG